MKKRLLFPIFLLIFINSISAQNELTEIEKLATTAKIWGFLKYYHPQVAEGNYNWDNQLVQNLSKVNLAKTKQELSNAYLEWINSLGKIEVCEKCTSKEHKNYFGKNFDFTWIKDSTIYSNELISKLEFIKKNRFQGNHYYFSTETTGNIKIQNEPEYSGFSWENKELRLLSLFKYWNYIEYFFPYKYQIDKDWDLVLKESITNFLNPKSEVDYHLAMLELIVNINDTHGYFSTNILKNHFGLKGIPAQFKIIDENAVISDFYNKDLADENNLQIGDVILEVDGKEIKTILVENDKYINGSNNSVKLRNYKTKIFNGSSNSIKIQFERNGKIEEKSIQRYLFQELNYKKPIKEKWKILDDNIGYINMGELERDDVERVMSSLLKTKAIIFDIRNYPKGTMYLIANFLNKKPQKFARFIKPDLAYPGKFNWTQTYICGRKNRKAYAGRVILLVNEKTQSHAEFTTMCLQTAENAIIIGSQTSGADGNVSKVKLVGGFETRFTGLGVFYPDRKETQRIGIVPDIEVKPTIEGIKNGKDEVLEKAIELASK